MMQLLSSDTRVPNLAKPEGVMYLLSGSKRPVLPQGFDKRSHTQGFNIELPPWQSREAISSALTPIVCHQEAGVVQPSVFGDNHRAALAR